MGSGIMCRGGKYKNGNPKRASRFICCKCLKENQIGSGIQRANQREKGHIKDLTCINPGCNGDITKNIEVRYCDSFDEMMEYAEELHNEYYERGGLINMKKYTWEAYDINDEVIGGGDIYAIDKDAAKEKIEKDLEENNDDWTEAGYVRYKIVTVVGI